jgi:protein arginine N-methyltransferase 3
MWSVPFAGFDLSAMAEHVYNDAVVDVVGPEAMISAPYAVKARVSKKIVSCPCIGV